MKIRNKLKTSNSPDIAFIRLNVIIGIILFVSITVLSVLYLILSWQRYKQTASDEAITLAQSLEAFLQPDSIEKLNGGAEETEDPEYIRIKNSLSNLVKTTRGIEFAYIMGIRDDKLVYLVNSEYPDSQGYFPTEQVYEDVEDNVLSVMQNGETVLTGKTKNRWGTWYNALVPIKDPSSGQTIAVFGLDFPVEGWNLSLWMNLGHDITIVLLLMLFMIAFFNARFNYYKLKRLSNKLAFNEALYRGVFNQAPIGIAIVSNEKFVPESEFGNSNMNPMYEQILGRSRQELESIKWMDITHPDDLQKNLEKFEAFNAGKIDGYSMTKRFLKPDGSYVWTNIKISHLMDGLRDTPMHLCLIDDISTEKEISDSLRESERSKSVLLSNLPGMAFRCKNDSDWTMEFVSDGCYELTGYYPESFINNKDLSFNDVILPEYRDYLSSEWARSLDEKQPFRAEYEIATASGEHKWVIEIGKGQYNEQGEAVAIEGIILDISARKKIENELKYNSEHDLVTGLYNHSYIETVIKKDYKEHLPTKKGFILFNISNLQSLSITYGYNYTQDIIKKVAEILNQFTAEDRILFRSFGTRFVYYVRGYKDKDEIMKLSRQIADAIKPIIVSERIGAGIGVYEINPDEEPDLNLISKNAWITSEKAVESEENEIGICYYDKNIQMQIELDEGIQRELNNIASNEGDGGLYLQYQPIFDLKTNKVCGFEALARLKTEELGQISPATFIPVAEKTKLIVPIGWKITKQAFSFLNKLKSLGYDKTYLSINFSPIQLMKHEFTENLFEMIDKMQLNPENICVEVTESAFSSGFDDINIIMDKLKNHGLSVAIDDFGTGYSSLSRERELNIDCVKIDKCFIDKLMTIKHDNAITWDIISIAHKLGHYTVAEGVEYEEQMQYLMDFGCDRIQGYMIGKPLDEEDAINLLDNQEKNRSECFLCNSGGMIKADTSLEAEEKMWAKSIVESILGIDSNGIITSCNNNCLKAFGYEKAKNLIGKNLRQFLYVESGDSDSESLDEREIFKSMHNNNGMGNGEEVFRRADGSRLDVEFHSYRGEKDGVIVGSLISFIDISHRKAKERELRYQNLHDTITGLYNRKYFEKSLTEFDKPDNLPLSVVFADIDGLKLTNDVFGHKVGDELIRKSAEILKASCKDGDFVARIGGDEFIILMPRTTDEDAKEVISKIKDGFANTRLSAVKSSFSLGFYTKTDENQSIEEIVANAERAMYNDKLQNRHSVGKEILNTIIEKLHSRNPGEKQHSFFVSELCAELGGALKLSENEISKLKRAGYLHDIGKISIEGSLLQNEDPEDSVQRNTQFYSAAGYRLLTLFDDTLDLAEYIYTIYERWDGTGYPLGLIGEQIPLISRIISIVDSYETILEECSPSENASKTALEKIKAESGKMFDPDITEVFVKLMESKNQILQTK